ncbi:MAG: class I SAM-dependent methyltransferase [Spirochaetes bacterium]|nr:class I SAM-dependent methyltransferase [Spirochaetota bacterium]
MKIIYKFITRLLLILHNKVYQYIGIFACKLENGKHPKHRLTDYHGFFVNNINKKDTVLDIGCGNGLLAYDMAGKARMVIGIDNNRKSIRQAKEQNQKKNIHYLVGDATSYNFKEKYEIVVLSNVLEHLDRRVDFLKKIKGLANKFLIRVPMIDRDWVTLYKKELGISYMLDVTHRIEYTFESFSSEIKKAGYKIVKFQINFGEIWSVLKQKE